MYGYGNSMFLATHGILARGGGVVPSLLLDTYPNAAVAYSLRKLRTAYTGSAIRVRRSVDNAEQDIGFSGNDLDTTTMLDFVGYNLLTYSEDITQQLVGGGRATYTNNVEVSPDSNLTGGKFATDGTFGEHYWFRNAITILNSTSYNISVYLKQAEFTKVRVSSNISGAAQNCDVDLTNGAISNNGFANTPIVTAEANGWYRFSVTITSGTTSSSPISIRLYNTSGAISFVGDAGKGIYVWGTQISQTSSVKTYQKTVATAGGNGFVTTWYDQSTNANNITRSVATQQPKIVNAGSVLTKGLKPCLDFDGADDLLSLNTALTTIASGNEFSIFNVHSSDLSNTLKTLWSNSPSGSHNQIRGFSDTRTSSPLNWLLSNSLNVTFSSTLSTVRNNTDQRLQVSVMDSGNVMRGFDNGATGGTNTYIGTYANTNLIIGSGANGLLNGTVQEFIIFDTNQLSNRTGIELNINTFYTIY